LNYKDGTKTWVVDGRIMRNGKTFGSRHFFKTKAQAKTKADQLRTLRRNEGASALSAADRPQRKPTTQIENDARPAALFAASAPAVGHLRKFPPFRD
jgi:hypothetical protein